MSRISDCLLPQLAANFPNRAMRLTPDHAPEVVFPAAHPDVGDIEIHDDGDELTVVLGKFTHTHFGNYDDDISEAERAEKICHAVVEFLQDVFTDQIEFYGSHKGGGGCQLRGRKPCGLLSRASLGGQTFVWSGPLRKDDVQ